MSKCLLTKIRIGQILSSRTAHLTHGGHMNKQLVIKGSKPLDPVTMTKLTKVSKSVRRAKDKVATLQRDEDQLRKQLERESLAKKFEAEVQLEAELDDWESFCHNEL